VACLINPAPPLPVLWDSGHGEIKVKLQLTPFAARRYAAILPDENRADGSTWMITRTASRVVEIFAQENHDPFTRRDVAAVMCERGWAKEDLQKDPGYDALSQAINGIPSQGRGYYTQGSRVGTPVHWAAPGPTPSAPPASRKALVPVTQYSVEIAAKAGVSWTPDIPEPVDGGWYDLDAGLRRMAVAQTPCFGYYDAEDSTCASCPLAVNCANAVLANLEAVAETLNLRTEASITAAQDKADAAAAAAARQKAAAAAPSPKPAPAPPKPAPAPKGPLSWPKGFKPLPDPLPWAGVCSGCRAATDIGSFVIHVSIGSNQGMYHEACARKVAGI
jgi:hypothetical protein